MGQANVTSSKGSFMEVHMLYVVTAKSLKFSRDNAFTDNIFIV